MKTLIVIFALLIWNGCSEESETPEAVALVETDAKWINMLATDGCAWHFEIMNKDSSYTSFAADDASIKTIDAALGKTESVYSFTDVRIKYSLTGNKKNVQCGWGAIANYPEIKIYEISKK